MPSYTPPLRDMQFVMHEVFKVTDDFKAMPQHADIDVDTINAVLEEAGKFATDVIFPLNISGDTEGCIGVGLRVSEIGEGQPDQHEHGGDEVA